MDNIDTFLSNLSNNKIFIGLAIIFMNVGSKYISIDLPKSLDNIFKHNFLRKFVIFCILFISTRDIKISILLTLVFVLLFSILLNENSSSCILPENYLNFESELDLNNHGKISADEVETVRKVLKKYKYNGIL